MVFGGNYPTLLPDDFYNAVRLFEQETFDLSAFHCPFPVALRDDKIEQIFVIISQVFAEAESAGLDRTREIVKYLTY